MHITRNSYRKLWILGWISGIWFLLAGMNVNVKHLMLDIRDFFSITTWTGNLGIIHPVREWILPVLVLVFLTAGITFVFTEILYGYKALPVSMLPERPMALSIPMLLVGLIFYACFAEVVFRGILFEWSWIYTFSPLWAGMLSSLFFSLFPMTTYEIGHRYFYFVLPKFVLGMLLCYITGRYGLDAAIAAHAIQQMLLHLPDHCAKKSEAWNPSPTSLTP